MATENIVTGKKFRILTDAVNKVWDRISYWTKASDVEFNDADSAQNKVGAIKGITTSTSVTQTGYAADASVVSNLNNSLSDIDIRYTSENGAEWSPRGAGTWHPFNGADAVFVNATRSYVINKDGSNYSTNAVGNNDTGAQTIINNLKKSDFIADATKYVGSSGYYYTDITLNKVGIYICGSFSSGTDFFLEYKDVGSVVTFDSITYGYSVNYLVYVGA